MDGCFKVPGQEGQQEQTVTVELFQETFGIAIKNSVVC